MGIKDIFKKKKEGEAKDETGDGRDPKYSEMLDQVDTSKLSFKEKMGLKMFKKMSKEKQEAALRQAMNPAEVMKNKEKILA